MRAIQNILGVAVFTFASGCNSDPQPNAQDTTTKAVAKVAKPPGVPTDATLVTGAQRIRSMLLGKRLQPVKPETNFDQGDEFFRSDNFWEKLGVGASEAPAFPYYSDQIEWRLDSYCVFYYERKRCTYLWRVKSDNLFAHHVYQDKNVSPPYAVVVTSFDAKKISGGKKGIRK